MREIRNKLSAAAQNNLKPIYKELYNLRDWWRIKRQKLFPYKFDKNRYPDLFLSKDHYPFSDVASKVDKVIYCFWTGENEMSDNRKKGYESLMENSGLEVKLITPKNVESYILPEHPLHHAYDNLSLVHKSDYLRCYFMHFHGGGYCDIKPNFKNWSKAFQLISENENCYILGTTEADGISMGRDQGIIDTDLQKNYLSCVGTCAFICRSNTRFTTEWYTELLNRMDGFAEELAKFPGDVKGRNPGYPVTLHGVLSQIFAPLCLKFRHNVIHHDIFPTRDNYQ